ncbi:hypothetical protein P7C71_g4159, partial [Lecanoromycetidae sp. Uapishka_2]
MNAVKTAGFNVGRLKRPSPLPLRPLRPNRFTPPRGEKQVFLPNFTIVLLREAQKPPHFATFLTPLWFNKLDLKDYLYNAYGVQALHVRSYIIHGKVVRDARTGHLSRLRQQKKMTIEMPQNMPFVWPEEPEHLDPWDVEVQRAGEQETRERREDRSDQGTVMGVPVEADRKTLKSQAEALLTGKTRWRPGWEDFFVP